MTCTTPFLVNPYCGSTKCTLYAGASLPFSGILNNDTLTTVIQKLDTKIATFTPNNALAVDETESVILSGQGNIGDPLIATVQVSANSDNILQVASDGLYVPSSSSGGAAVFGNSYFSI